MAYVVPPNFAAGAVLTEAQLDILSDDIVFLANPPKCRVYNSAGITTTTAVEAALTFNSERFDTDTMHSTSVNTDRITFTTAGTYLVGGNVRWTSNASGYRYLGIAVNGGNKIVFASQPPASGVDTMQAVSTLYAFSAGDYITLQAAQTSGGNLDVTATAAHSPEFWAIWQSL